MLGSITQPVRGSGGHSEQQVIVGVHIAEQAPEPEQGEKAVETGSAASKDVSSNMNRPTRMLTEKAINRNREGNRARGATQTKSCCCYYRSK